jgi:hypothetical protein
MLATTVLEPIEEAPMASVIVARNDASRYPSPVTLHNENLRSSAGSAR